MTRDLTRHWQLWIDTGGTFTDCLAISPEGERRRLKVLSSGCLRGQLTERLGDRRYRFSQRWPVAKPLLNGYSLRLLSEPDWMCGLEQMDDETQVLTLSAEISLPLPQAFELSAGEEAPVLAARLLTATPLTADLPPLELRLGTTRGTNALLERQGAKVAFLVTKGFADLVYIGTQQRPHLFQLAIPEPSLLYSQVIEVDERLDAEGRVLRPLSEDEIARVLAAIDAEAVAVALVHAYRNPAHERALGAALSRAGYAYVSLSHALSPGIKILPRAQTALVNAYLSPVMSRYLERIRSRMANTRPGDFLIMGSAGGLSPFDTFVPKDGLLSGPAGGVVGAAHIARQLGYQRVLTLDMGGTSTDTARYDGHYDYRFLTRIDDIELQSPGLAIETVAAGGGSVCGFDGRKLTVGPASAGAWPGPACYGAGGPLTLTDVNLLLGKLYPEALSIPIQLEAARAALEKLLDTIDAVTGRRPEAGEILGGLERIANEKMAEAIRRISVAQGFDPRDYALLAFGGAGGLHASAIAELLGMTTVLLPRDAGLLSAYGIGHARVERLAQRQLLQTLETALPQLDELIQELSYAARQQLADEGFGPEQTAVSRVLLFLRYRGQETPLEIVYQSADWLQSDFETAYAERFGYLPTGLAIELESIRVFAATHAPEVEPLSKPSRRQPAQTWRPARGGEQERSFPVYRWEGCAAGDRIDGPALLSGEQASAFVAPGWALTLWPEGHAVIEQVERSANIGPRAWSETVELELFTNRFTAIAAEMGAQLQRTAFSVNVKERLDFSCALLDAEARLLVNAPHIPVHLGSLGICARLVLERLPLAPGDVAIVNHPAYGGSHLPDITLLRGIFTDDGRCIGYAINRAHHAEIGGKRPGSMPPDARSLAEEGVIFAPSYLVRAGVPQWDAIEAQLQAPPWPSRAPADNLADLKAALAALQTGHDALRRLVATHGLDKVHHYMEALQRSAREQLRQALQAYEGQNLTAVELLDDGHRIQLSAQISDGRLRLDFSGSSPVHPGNLNANLSIVYSAVIYVLRLLCEKDIPLNEGLLRDVDIQLPAGSFLSPHFSDDPTQCPAVVGGNTEVSQRLVDTLLKAFGLAAASQGTMNNFLFGNEQFGYYETIGGGAGAVVGSAGRSGVHQHMTNTRITDAEELERRYPVRLHRFALRKGSGGRGRWPGGDGLVREVEALVPLSATLLSQRRQSGPYGLAGGEAGQPGRQYLIHPDGHRETLAGSAAVELAPGVRVVVETPGGGGVG